MSAPPAMNTFSAAPTMFRCRGGAPPQPVRRPAAGRSCAARVSRGSEGDVWLGLAVKEPRRHASEHVTVTVVVYNMVQGGVPSAEDVLRAIDDLESLYEATGAPGYLAGH